DDPVAGAGDAGAVGAAARPVAGHGPVAPRRDAVREGAQGAAAGDAAADVPLPGVADDSGDADLVDAVVVPIARHGLVGGAAVQERRRGAALVHVGEVPLQALSVRPRDSDGVVAVAVPVADHGDVAGRAVVEGPVRAAFEAAAQVPLEAVADAAHHA